jgi:hypothetical protein
MLPEGLVLGPQSLFPPGQHPALFLFGHHQGVRPNILHVLGMDYLEFLIAIPHVQWKTATNPYRGPFAFMPRLYLDRLLPVLGGWLYGYAKRRARIRADERTYEVRSLLGNSPLITGRFTPRGNPGPLSAFPNFAELAELFQQPFVAQTLLGFFCCSHQDFELDQATMQALEADVDVATAFLPGLPTGSRHFSGIDQVPRGAFRIRVPWTLPPPFDCACLRVRFPADPFPQ